MSERLPATLFYIFLFKISGCKQASTIMDSKVNVLSMIHVLSIQLDYNIVEKQKSIYEGKTIEIFW